LRGILTTPSSHPLKSRELEKAMSGEYYDADDIDWEHLERYTD
jgi:hypothetical protein